MFRAVVEDVREQRRVAGRAVWELLLSETEFVAGDVGRLTATSRMGSRLELRVLAVVVGADGGVWHVVEKPLALGTGIDGFVEA